MLKEKASGKIANSLMFPKIAPVFCCTYGWLLNRPWLRKRTDKQAVLDNLDSGGQLLIAQILKMPAVASEA